MIKEFKIFLLCFLFTAHGSLSTAQVWLPVCEGVRLKNGNPSVSGIAYNSTTDELFVGGDFDSLCHRFYNGAMKYNGSVWDTINKVYYAVGHSKITAMIFDSVIIMGTEDGFIGKYFGINLGQSLGDANGPVYALEYYKGDLYAAGNFSKIAWNGHSVTAYNIARWDGTSWYAMGNGLTYQFNDSYVFALKEWNNELYAGGFFKNEYGHCIARWNGSQWLDTIPGFGATWSAFGEEVKALEVYNGQLYAGGFFDRAGKTTIYNIASWDSTIKKWQSVGGGVCCRVNVLNEIDGRLWAGGYIGVIYYDNIKWHSVGFTTSGIVHALEGYHGDIFVGGSSFAYADSLETIFSPCFARLDLDSVVVSVTEQANEREQLKVYPNPVTDKLTISSEQLAVSSIEIKNMLGQTILLTTHDSQLTTELDVSGLMHGIYVIEVRNKQGVVYRSKVVKN